MPRMIKSKKAQEPSSPVNWVVVFVLGALVVGGVFFFIIRSEIRQRLSELPFEEYEVEETVEVESKCKEIVGYVKMTENGQEILYRPPSPSFTNLYIKKYAGRNNIYVTSYRDGILQTFMNWIRRNFGIDNPVGRIENNVIKFKCAIFNPEVYTVYMPTPKIPWSYRRDILPNIGILYNLHNSLYSGVTKEEGAPLCKDMEMPTYEEGIFPVGCLDGTLEGIISELKNYALEGVSQDVREREALYSVYLVRDNKILMKKDKNEEKYHCLFGTTENYVDCELRGLYFCSIENVKKCLVYHFGDKFVAGGPIEGDKIRNPTLIGVVKEIPGA